MSSFTWQARVYWEDTDAGGIVYYANYLRFLERARSEWLRARGISQRQLAIEPGVVFSVVALQVQYLQAARLDDLLLISCEPRQPGGASIQFTQRIWREDAEPRGEPGADPGPEPQLLLSASVRVACLDAGSMKPRRLPAVVIEELV